MIRITETENGQMQIQAKAQTLKITVTPPSVLNRDFVSFWLTQYVEFLELITEQGLKPLFCEDENAFDYLKSDTAKMVEEVLEIPDDKFISSEMFSFFIHETRVCLESLITRVMEFIGLFPRYHVVDNQVYSVVLSGFERFLQQAQDALTLLEEERVALQKALRDIAAVYPPFDSDKRTAKAGQEFLIRVIEEMGIENALTPSAIILLGSMNRESQGY